MKHYMYFSKHSIYIKIDKYTLESFIKDIPPGVLLIKQIINTTEKTKTTSQQLSQQWLIKGAKILYNY